MFSSLPLSLSLLLCCVKVEQAKEYEGDHTTQGVERERREGSERVKFQAKYVFSVIQSLHFRLFDFNILTFMME